MPRKKRSPLTLAEKIKKVKSAGLNNTLPPNLYDPYQEKIENLNERIERILGICNKSKNILEMVYFIMYDIENDKVRNLIAKYLKKNGCTRIQRSVFLASTDRDKYNEIHQTLKQVQEFYDNSDSIVIVPVTPDSIRTMKLIGQNVNIDLALGNNNTLFF
jgi:CRISPR-associated protein Cas2